MTRTPGDLVRFRGEVAEEEEASAVVLLSSAARRSAAAALRGTAIGSEMVRGGDGGENGVRWRLSKGGRRRRACENFGGRFKIEPKRGFGEGKVLGW